MNTRLDKLTFETADVIFDSWDAVKRIPDYDVVVGEMMFRKLFENSPSTLKNFSFGPRFAGKEESLYKSRTFEIHTKAMIKMLEDVLSMIMPDLVPMKKTLKALGARHVTYGVRPNHYELATEALLSTLESLLGYRWTPQVEEGWKTAIGFITNTMVAGGNKYLKKRRKERLNAAAHVQNHRSGDIWEEPVVDKKNTPTRKVSFDVPEEFKKHPKACEQDSDSATMSTSGSDSILDHWEENDINYMKLVEDVYESWDIIKSIPNYSKVTGALLFQNIFEASPQAKQLFQFAKSYQENDGAVYKDVGFLVHANTVVNMLDTCVGMMGPDMEPVTKALEDLGARHCQYNVTDTHYSIVGEALLKTLETSLGDVWTPQMKKSWAGIYDFMSSAMQKGASDYKAESADDQVEI